MTKKRLELLLLVEVMDSIIFAENVTITRKNGNKTPQKSYIVRGIIFH